MAGLWNWMESNGRRLFMAAGVMLALDAVVVVGEIVSGTENLLVLGEALSALGWIFALIGLLGLYQDLVDPSPWLARIGAVFSVIGVVTFVVLVAVSLVYGAGLVDGDAEAIVPFALPGVILGSILGFVLFSAAVLRTEQRSRRLGLLLLVPPTIVVLNILTGVAGIESSWVLLLVVIALAGSFVSIGGAIHTQDTPTSSADERV